MPELPEVEIVCRSLEKPLHNCTFVNIVMNRNNLRYPFPKYLKEYLINYKVIQLYRKAKYIIIALENSYNLIIHLGMSGRLRLLQTPPLTWGKHDHVIFTLKPAQQSPAFTLIYHDPRRFGLIDIIKTEDLVSHRYFKHLGPDPLDNDFTIDHFSTQFKKSRKTLKQTLLDQRILVGVGNIYACEALFQAGLSPYRRACDLGTDAMTKLYTAVRHILNQAIAQGGSSFKDYQHIDGKQGQFQTSFTVYNQQYAPCPRCATQPIQRDRQQGRSTFYCSHCQK